MLKTNLSIVCFSLVCIVLFTSALPAKEVLAEDVVKLTNQYRRSKGLPVLIMRSDLNDIARKHSEDMAKGRRSFGHGGMNERMIKVQKSIQPYQAMAENVAYGAKSGKEAVSIWKNSSAHRKNMLGKYKYIGVGTASNRRGVIYYTQIFVR